MVPRVVLASSPKRPGNGEGGFPLDTADHLGHGVLRGNGEEPGHVIRQQVALYNTTCLVLRQRAKDISAMPPPFVLEPLPTIRRAGSVSKVEMAMFTLPVQRHSD